MKQNILIIAILAIASLKSIAQDIEYAYDLAGNRTIRKVIPPTPPPATAKMDTDGNNTGAEEGELESEVYKDQLGEKQVRIYPNPTRGKLAIEIVNYNLETNGSIQVFDMSGRMLQNISILSEQLEVDITKEPSGSYIMIIVIGKEKSEWKIIKN